MGSLREVDGDYTPQPILCNNTIKPWIVKKYGGTSIGKFADSVTDDITR